MSSDSFDPYAPESALLPAQRQTLSEANRLLEENKPAQAAPLFAKLAEVLTSAGQPRRAAHLHAQAAMAFAKSRNESALTQARAGLTLLLKYKLDQQATEFYANLHRELVRRGLQTAAETLANEFGTRLAQSAPVTPQAAQLARLPSNCPHCGAPLRSSDVHWIDAVTMECGFCGTPIRPPA